MNLDRQKVLHAARNGIPLVIQTSTLPPETQVELEEVLAAFLESLGRPALLDHLSYCLRELTGNAKKANTKRVYFEQKGWDIADPVQYKKGMATFKAQTLDDIGTYLALQERAGLTIRTVFLIRGNVLFLSVRNNTPILPAELSRAYDRMARSRAFTSMAEAFEEVLDDSEGAGLGIVILVLMLRKLGLDEKALSFDTPPGETVVTLRIPMDAARVADLDQLAEELSRIVDSLPPFPENLRELMNLLDQPNVEFRELAARLGLDPALTADLIRHINVASLGAKRRVSSLHDAVQILGLKGLRAMLVPYGAQKLLGRFVEKQKDLWADAQRIAHYAGQLAARRSSPVAGLAEIGGLLSILGQIVVTYLHPDLGGQIAEFCRARDLTVDRFDEVTQTLNPAELGARVAQKWQFPDELVQILRHQTHPQDASPSLQLAVCAVHLARSLVLLEHGLIGEDQLAPAVIKALGLGEPGKLEAEHTRLRASIPSRG